MVVHSTRAFTALLLCLLSLESDRFRLIPPQPRNESRTEGYGRFSDIRQQLLLQDNEFFSNAFPDTGGLRKLAQRLVRSSQTNTHRLPPFMEPYNDELVSQLWSLFAKRVASEIAESSVARNNYENLTEVLEDIYDDTEELPVEKTQKDTSYELVTPPDYVPDAPEPGSYEVLPSATSSSSNHTDQRVLNTDLRQREAPHQQQNPEPLPIENPEGRQPAFWPFRLIQNFILVVYLIFMSIRDAFDGPRLNRK